MKARWKVYAVAAFLVALFVAVILITIQPKPPRLYNGKTFAEWIALVHWNEPKSEARETLVGLGDKAVPELEEILAWRPNRWRDRLSRQAVRYRVMKPQPLPKVQPLELQGLACEAAYHLAEDSKVDTGRLVPQLRFHFTNGHYADANAPRALAHAGPNGITVLTNFLFNGTRPIRDQSGWALRFVNQKPQVISALITSALTEQDQVLKANALRYLEKSQAPPEQIVPLALKFFRDDDANQRWAAVFVLQDYGDQPEVPEVFQQALKDEDARVRDVATRFLKPKLTREQILKQLPPRPQ